MSGLMSGAPFLNEMSMVSVYLSYLWTKCLVMIKKRDADHWEKGDHSGAKFGLCTVYGHILTNRIAMIRIIT